MAIPESQLETWSHQGSIAQSSNTYNSIKGVLEDGPTPYANKKFEVFLQGSYVNSTNINAESDVDIVIRLDSCFQSDLSDLSEGDRALYKATFVDATYTHVDFKNDVTAVLKGQYGKDAMVGDKAIVIAASGSRRKADVIAAIQYRRYLKFKSTSDSTYVEGICFWNASGEKIANYPKQHAANLTAKHQASASWLKPVVRIFKNMRSRLVEEGLIEARIAPSYFVEGLLYNVLNEKLQTSYQNCVANVLNWYQQDADKSDLLCANEQYYLLRDGYLTCWPQANADAFVSAAVNLWNEW